MPQRWSCWLLVAAILVTWDSSQTFSQSTASLPPTGSPETESTASQNTTPAAREAQQQQFLIMQMLDQLPPYRPTEKLSGRTTLSGSRTMSDMAHQWAQNFKLFHPGIEFVGTAEGSEVALRLLSEDPTIIAGVSRPVDESDQKMLQAGKCKEPIAITIGMEAMALYVHQSNPLASVSPETVKAIFAAGKDGKPKAKVWGDLGVQGALSHEPITVYERDAGSGSRVFISRVLLGGAELTSSLVPCSSNTELFKAISKDPKGVGFADLNFEHPDVRRVPLVVQGELVQANEVNVWMGKYPIVRPLMLVLDRDQLAKDGKFRESVLRYVLSRDGQITVMKAGFFPLDPGFVHQQLTELFGTQLR
jgi:phosphate transport system substrate-binding protein